MAWGERLTVVLVMVAGWLHPTVISAQDLNRPLEVYKPLDQGGYARILDKLFSQPPEPTGFTVFRLKLRFMPSFDVESQILIVLSSGKGPLVEFEVASKQIYRTANESIRSTGKVPEPSTLAAEVTVRKTILSVPGAETLVWQREMFSSINKAFASLENEAKTQYRGAPTHLITLDGTLYELSYQQGLTEFSYQFDDSPPATALAKWAQSLRREVLKWQAKSGGKSPGIDQN